MCLISQMNSFVAMNFKPLEEQASIINYDQLRKRREPEKTEKRITHLIKSIEETKKHNSQILTLIFLFKTKIKIECRHPLSYNVK